jgi:hypothetical protein
MMMIMGKGGRNAAVDRCRWLETPLQKMTYRNGNDIRKKKENKKFCCKELFEKLRGGCKSNVNLDFNYVI